MAKPPIADLLAQTSGKKARSKAPAGPARAASLAMIEKHYGHLLGDHAANALAVLAL